MSIKQKPKQVGNKLGKFTFFVIIVFHYSLARQCLWSLPGEALFKSLPQNARPVSPTGLRNRNKKTWIHNHYSLDYNYSSDTQSAESHIIIIWQVGRMINLLL